MGKKFAVTSDIECRVIERFGPTHGVTTTFISSARVMAARYTVCDEKKLKRAIRTGSLHAIDYGPFFTDNETDSGGAIRMAFNPTTVAAWAKDDAATIAAHRLENVARLNANKPDHSFIGFSCCSAGTCLVAK